MRVFQRSQNRKAETWFPHTRLGGREQPGLSGPGPSLTHSHTSRQARGREGCVSKSSQLLFHLLALLDGPLGTQATPPFSVTRGFLHSGGTPPTAYPVTGRLIASGNPPCPTSPREEESRNQTGQYTEPALPQGLSWALGHSSHPLPRHQAMVWWGRGTPLALPLALALLCCMVGGSGAG